jgi:hypothetical protein
MFIFHKRQTENCKWIFDKGIDKKKSELSPIVISKVLCCVSQLYMCILKWTGLMPIVLKEAEVIREN